MDRIKLTCLEVEPREGFSVVHLNFESVDPTISAGGIISFTISDASNYVVGNSYGLDLNEIPPTVGG